MTVINNIEIDDIKYCENEIKAAICNNEPIEDREQYLKAITTRIHELLKLSDDDEMMG